MADVVREALEAGAIGFATSRTEVHRTSAGASIPTLTVGRASCWPSPAPCAPPGTGVIQLISDLYQTPDDALADAEMALLAEVVRRPAARSASRCSRRTTRPSGGGTRWPGSTAWSRPATT